MKADWPAAASQLRAEIESQPLVADQFTFTTGPRSRQGSPRRIAAIAQLNASLAEQSSFTLRRVTPDTEDLDEPEELEELDEDDDDDDAKPPATMRGGPPPPPPKAAPPPPPNPGFKPRPLLPIVPPKKK